MLVSLALAGLLLAGADVRFVALAAIALWHPLWLLALGLGWIGWSRWRAAAARPDATAEMELCAALAAELDAGASLRTALLEAAARVPRLETAHAVRLAEAGRPMHDVGDALAAATVVNRQLIAAAFRIASQSGGRASALFTTLAERAREELALRRERRAATAQARFSALVIGVGPLLVTAFMIVSGRANAVLERGAIGVLAMAVGVGLQLVGLAVIAAVLRSQR